MCGISGYIGNKLNYNLISSLYLLEYRGYDSAGIACVIDGNIETTKCAGKISKLESMLSPTKATCGIGHTRWATHGKPTKENTHPHSSNSGEWAIVHNGIIENFAELKSELKSKGYSFKSETDSEVIANLLDHYNEENKINALINVCKKLTGSYALAVLNKNYNNTIYLAKNKSPLYVSKNSSEVFVASDPICFLNKTVSYYSLLDNEFCVATLDGFTFYNSKGEQIEKSEERLENLEISSSKGGYPYFMLKEINEVPKVLEDIAGIYKSRNILKMFTKDFITKFNNIVLIGCGTAYHAALMGEKYLLENARLSTSSHIASEYRYSSPILSEKTLCILVSQSGETADTLAVASLAKSKNATTIALTNVLYSSLARTCDYILPICAGTEIAVASTKAYSAQVAVLYMLSKHLQNVLFNKNFNYIAKMQSFAKKLKINSPESVSELAMYIKNQDHLFFIGRNFDYITCKEASLKLKEITYIHTAEHPAGELKHGFLSLIDSSSTVIVIATNSALLEKTLNGAFEAISRGAKVILFTQIPLPKSKLEGIYKCVKLQKFDEELMPIASISYFQMLAYMACILKGYSPDQPRNLAKSVTVE